MLSLCFAKRQSAAHSVSGGQDQSCAKRAVMGLSISVTWASGDYNLGVVYSQPYNMGKTMENPIHIMTVSGIPTLIKSENL